MDYLGLGSNKGLQVRDEISIEELFYPTMKVLARKTPEEIIKQGQDELKEIEKERWLNHTKNWRGFALELESAAILLATGPKLAAGLAKTLTSVFGRKIAMEAATGIIDGGLSGAIQGLGEGMINDADLAESILNGAAVGTSGGALMGLGAGKASQLYSKNNILNTSNNKELLYDYFDNYVSGLTNQTKELAEYRRLKNNVNGKFTTAVLYDEMGKIKPIHLDETEYAIVMHELNTNLTKEELQDKIITKNIGNYKYTIKIKGFNDYEIIEKREIK